VLCDENKARVQAQLDINNRLVEPRLAATETTGVTKVFGSAVLVPFCTYQGKPSILYTIRSRKLRSHRSDISFPGGKVEEQDNGDAIETAVRECCEELTISKESIDVWGKVLREAKYIRPQYLTTPVIANLGIIEELDLKMQAPSFEVEKVIIVPLEHLCDPSNQGYTAFKMVHPREEVDKYYNVLFHHPEKRIWGMCANFTAFILPLLYTPFKTEKTWGFFK